MSEPNFAPEVSVHLLEEDKVFGRYACHSSLPLCAACKWIAANVDVGSWGVVHCGLKRPHGKARFSMIFKRIANEPHVRANVHDVYVFHRSRKFACPSQTHHETNCVAGNRCEHSTTSD